MPINQIDSRLLFDIRVLEIWLRERHISCDFRSGVLGYRLSYSEYINRRSHSFEIFPNFSIASISILGLRELFHDLVTPCSTNNLANSRFSASYRIY